MWKPLENCDRQIRIHSKLKETTGDTHKIYQIVEIEFDQYHLSLIQVNKEPVNHTQYNILTCAQLKKYAFEIEE